MISKHSHFSKCQLKLPLFVAIFFSSFRYSIIDFFASANDGISDFDLALYNINFIIKL